MHLVTLKIHTAILKNEKKKKNKTSRIKNNCSSIKGLVDGNEGPNGTDNVGHSESKL